MAEDDLPPEEGVADAIDAPVEDDAVVIEGGDDTPPEPTVDDLASEMGWTPKDQWRGDPDKWKPAHEFMRATVDVNHKLGNKLKSFEDQLAAMARTSAQLTERAVAQERQRILDARREAIDMGDHAGVEAADEGLRSLPKPEAVTTPPETRDFVARNEWFGKDQEATVWAQNRAQQLYEQGIGPARQLSIVEREAKGLFPELFPEPKAKAKAAPLNEPGNRGARPAAKGFSAMPADAQAAALDYEKRGYGKRDEYARIYFEEA
jgi:predicted transcriptional regulator